MNGVFAAACCCGPFTPIPCAQFQPSIVAPNPDACPPTVTAHMTMNGTASYNNQPANWLVDVEFVLEKLLPFEQIVYNVISSSGTVQNDVAGLLPWTTIWARIQTVLNPASPQFGRWLYTFTVEAGFQDTNLFKQTWKKQTSQPCNILGPATHICCANGGGGGGGPACGAPGSDSPIYDGMGNNILFTTEYALNVAP